MAKLHLLCALGCGLLLTACGGGGSDSSAADTSATTVIESASVISPVEDSGNTPETVSETVPEVTSDTVLTEGSNTPSVALGPIIQSDDISEPDVIVSDVDVDADISETSEQVVSELDNSVPEVSLPPTTDNTSPIVVEEQSEANEDTVTRSESLQNQIRDKIALVNLPEALSLAGEANSNLDSRFYEQGLELQDSQRGEPFVADVEQPLVD